MPTILLINSNKIVSRLLQLSSQKHRYKLEEISDYTPEGDAYNIVFVDSEIYESKTWETFKEGLVFDKLGFISDKTTPAPEGFDLVLEKPFLPTDFVALVDANFKVVDLEESLPTDLEEMESVLDEDDEEFDLENLDTLIEDDALDDIVLDEEDVTGLPETTLTTGIATSMSQEQSEEIADMVDEIDEMEGIEPLEEMDLDDLVEAPEDATLENGNDEIVDDSSDASESKQEASSEEAPTEEMDLDELVDEKVNETLQEVQAEIEATAPLEVDGQELDERAAASLVGAGVAAVSVATALASEEDTQKEQEKESEVLVEEDVIEESILEEVVSLKSETESKTEALKSEDDAFSSLKEADVAKVMAGEVLVSESFSEVDESTVEPQELEEIITRAVSKAITKEMLQEALGAMDISVTVKKKD